MDHGAGRWLLHTGMTQPQLMWLQENGQEIFSTKTTEVRGWLFTFYFETILFKALRQAAKFHIEAGGNCAV